MISIPLRRETKPQTSWKLEHNYLQGKCKFAFPIFISAIHTEEDSSFGLVDSISLLAIWYFREIEQ